jgi:hypothetical protein
MPFPNCRVTPEAMIKSVVLAQDEVMSYAVCRIMLQWSENTMQQDIDPVLDSGSREKRCDGFLVKKIVKICDKKGAFYGRGYELRDGTD